MEYVFFDIECANCYDNKGKVCEFGYVVTNDRLEITDGDEILINPDAPFDWYALKKILSYPKETYLKAEKYPAHFYKIKSALTANGRIIIGQNTKNDLFYLADESKRYGLEFLNVEFYDLSVIYKRLYNLDNPLSVEKMLTELKIEPDERLHIAMNDAKATAVIMKKLSENFNLSAAEMLKSYGVKQSVRNGRFADKTLPEMLDELKDGGEVSNADKQRFISLFVQSVRVEKRIDSVLTGKRLCLSETFEKEHVLESAVIIAELIKRGARYSTWVAENDLLIVGDDEITDKTTAHGRCRIAHNNKVKIITLSELLPLIGLTEQELTNENVPKLNKIKDKLILK